MPPSAFAPTTEALKEHDLATGTKVVYEKPYGTSLDSLHELDALVHTVFDEEQVFRIDHFLGKEATQNVHMLRFANTMISRVWDRDSIEEVQIDVPETLDIADRAAFYDATGAALDMLVTHLFQVAAEVAMEPPTSFAPEDLQAARESVISAFRPLDPADVVLGQFDGYRQTEGIADDSTTDTYVAAKLWVDTDRWRDVPFVLRTGKRLKGGAQRLSLLFRAPDGPLHSAGTRPEVLAFDLEGSGRILMELTVKDPGPDFVPERGRATSSGWTRWPRARWRRTRPSSTTCSGATAPCSPARSGWPPRSPPSRRCSDPTARTWCPTPRAAGDRRRPTG